MGASEGGGRAGTREIRSRHELLDDARAQCPLEDLIPVRAEAFVGQIRSNVDEFDRQGRSPECAIVTLHMVIGIRRLQGLTRLIPRGIALLASVALALPCLAQMGGDIQAQILYAYETEDLNQMTDLVQSLSTDVKANGADLALRYHLAHADYRLAQLLGDAHRRQAEAALADCAEQVSKLLDHDSRSVEALVLSSACLEDLAKFRKVEGVILRSKAADRLSTASKLAARNPRVLLLRATNDLERAKPGSPESAQAFAELQLAAQRFDETSATNLDAPGWGHADAYLALGRQYLRRGDVLAARNWIEKSLIAAPDFKAAQRQLAALTQH